MADHASRPGRQPVCFRPVSRPSQRSGIDVQRPPASVPQPRLVLPQSGPFPTPDRTVDWVVPRSRAY